MKTLLAFIVGLIFFLPFPGWQQLVGFVTSATVLSFGSGPLVLMALRKELPDYKRPFRLSGGWTIPYLAFLSSNLIVLWSGWDIVWKLMAAVLLGFLILAIHEAVQRGHTPRLDFRSGFWVLPWLGGLTLIGWLGHYPDPAMHAGNLGLLDLGSEVIVTAVFSALIMWLAHAFRLRGERVNEHVSQSWLDDTGDASV